MNALMLATGSVEGWALAAIWIAFFVSAAAVICTFLWALARWGGDVRSLVERGRTESPTWTSTYTKTVRRPEGEASSESKGSEL